MTTEQINDYLEKRIAEYKGAKEFRDKNIMANKIYYVDDIIKELEAIHKLTNVIQSRSSQEIKVIDSSEKLINGWKPLTD